MSERNGADGKAVPHSKTRREFQDGFEKVKSSKQRLRAVVSSGRPRFHCPWGPPLPVALRIASRIASPFMLSSFKLPAIGAPELSASTQPPPTWLPVLAATQTQCLVLFEAVAFS